jgi:hypothetical protein
MLRVTFDFTWERPVRRRGFVLEGGSILPAPGAAFVRYRPLEEEPGLFRTFAALPPGPEGLLDFANSYGELGEWPSLRGLTYEQAKASGGGGRREKRWDRDRNRMGCAVRLWDALDAGAWDDVRAALGDVRAALAVLPGPDFLDPPEGQKPDELTAVALRALMQVFIGPIRDFASMFASMGGVIAGLWPAVGGWDARSRQPCLHIAPYSLLQAMHVQFVRSILGGLAYRRCPACGRFFEVGPGAGTGGRSDKFACTTSCRVKLYKQRQARARQLRAEGWTVRDIARELGSEVVTVKKWVSQQHKE